MAPKWQEEETMWILAVLCSCSSDSRDPENLRSEIRKGGLKESRSDHAIDLQIDKLLKTHSWVSKVEYYQGTAIGKVVLDTEAQRSKFQQACDTREISSEERPEMVVKDQPSKRPPTQTDVNEQPRKRSRTMDVSASTSPVNEQEMPRASKVDSEKWFRQGRDLWAEMETALKNANRENESLRTEMETLRKKMETLREENETLREENETLREENERTLAEEKNKREKAENQLANLKLDTSFLTKERLYDFLKKEQTYNQFFSRLGDIEDSESYPEEFDQSALKERWRNLQDSISQCFGNQNDPPAGVSDLGGLLMESIFGNSHMWPNYDPQDNRLLHCLFQCLADGVKRDNANPGPQSGFKKVRQLEGLAWHEMIAADNPVPEKAGDLSAKLCGLLEKYWDREEASATRIRHFYRLVEESLTLRLDLLMSGKSYEFRNVRPGEDFDDSYMQVGSGDGPAPSSAEKVKYQVLPAIYRHPWPEFERAEDARLRSIQFFPEEGRARKGGELICQAVVLLE